MFHRCEDEKQAKDLYKKLAKFLHPDAGGDHSLMILLSESYEYFIKINNHAKGNNEKKKSIFKYEEVDDLVFQDDEEKLHIIVEMENYAENHKRYNTSFIDSLKEYMQEKGFLTSSQYNALVKNYYSFRMDKEEEKKENDDSVVRNKKE